MALPRRLLAVLLVAAPVPGLAQAQAAPPVPVCIPAREGMVACFSSRLCTCRFEPGGSLTGRPEGFRWDCSALRPDCGVVPPDAGGGAAYRLQDLPPLLLSPQLPQGAARETPIPPQLLPR